MTDDEAIDLIEGYEEWRQKRATQGPDLSARAYLEEQRAARQLEHGSALEAAVTKALGTLESAVYAKDATQAALRDVLGDVYEDLRRAL